MGQLVLRYAALWHQLQMAIRLSALANFQCVVAAQISAAIELAIYYIFVQQLFFVNLLNANG